MTEFEYRAAEVLRSLDPDDWEICVECGQHRRKNAPCGFTTDLHTSAKQSK